jgi:hypothetical protein
MSVFNKSDLLTLNELGVKGFVLRSTSVNSVKREFSIFRPDLVVINVANNGGSLIKDIVNRGLLQLNPASLKEMVTNDVEMVS